MTIGAATPTPSAQSDENHLHRAQRGYDLAVWLFWVLLFSAATGYSAWIATDGRVASKTPTAYYHYATEAMLDGRWHLSLTPRGELATLADPYDPAQNQPYRALDLTYYRNKYYFYWGLAPVVLLYAPIRLLSGWYLAESIGSALFGVVAFGAMAALLLGMRRNYAPSVGASITHLCLLLTGLGSLLFLLSLHNTVYGVPIASAAAGQCLAWWCIWRALQHPDRAARWTWGAGFGLAVCLASRPNAVLWMIVYLLPWAVLVRRQPVRAVALSMAAAIPPFLTLLTLMYVNWVRFGSVADFGMQYQLTGPAQPDVLFGFSELWRNLGVYVWNPPRVSRYWPFFTTAGTGPFGVLSAVPALYLIPALWAWRRRAVPLTVAATVAFSGLGGMLATCAFFGSGLRYMIDFMPGLSLAGALGALGLIQAVNPALRRWATALAGAALLVSNAVLGGLHGQNLEMIGRNVLPVARCLNAPLFAWERWQEPPRGAVTLSFTLPAGRFGAFEPLISVGHEAEGGEIVFLHYVDEGHVQVGVFQTGTTHWLSAPLAVDYAQSHRLFLTLGSLMPPESHPAFVEWSSEDRARNQQRVVVALDGELVYETRLDFRAGRRVPAVVGRNDVFPGASSKTFTGLIQEVQWHEVRPDIVEQNVRTTASATEYGPWQLRFQLPESPAPGSNDPLLVSGRAGAGNFVYIFYPQPGYVGFGHDAWGVGGTSSLTVAVDFTAEHVVEISHGGLYPPTGSAFWMSVAPERQTELKETLRIWLNGELVAEFRDRAYDATPDSVTPFENRIGGSSTGPRFRGRAISAERRSHAPASE